LSGIRKEIDFGCVVDYTKDETWIDLGPHCRVWLIATTLKKVLKASRFVRISTLEPLAQGFSLFGPIPPDAGGL
jgi:hypothetical protein